MPDLQELPCWLRANSGHLERAKEFASGRRLTMCLSGVNRTNAPQSQDQGDKVFISCFFLQDCMQRGLELR